MQTKFSENIKSLRKEHHVTQEQLAEAMGVTTGAIYKWEQNLSTPDISIIMEIASFFRVSVDALVGYKMCTSDKERILQTLKQIKVEKDYENFWDEVDSWIHRYPNDFDIVYNSGVIYNLAGIETGNNHYLSRSIELMNHASRLLDQNKDPQINETTICRDIAVAYLYMGKSKEGLEQLELHNPCGINDDLIGQELAVKPERREEALRYLSRALISNTSSLYRVVVGYVNIFFSRKDYSSAVQIIHWMSAYIDGLRTEKGPTYLDKEDALLLTLCGMVCEKIGNIDEAKKHLRKARQTALRFDAAPDYTSQNIRYYDYDEPHISYDNIGSTAMETILHMLEDGIDFPKETTLKLWEEICNEE